jgi:hypothetical protein
MANRILKTLCFGLAIFLMIGCVPKYTWKADPVIQTIDNQSYTAQIKPVERYKGIFAGFKLTVDNKTGQDIEIDWNKTLYLQNNQTNGGFMFEGIVYADRNNPKAPDVVFANDTFKKEIWPSNLVYYSRSLTAEFSGWEHKGLPAGQNGIYLTMRINGHEVHEKLMVDVTIVKE